jgi:hypothetical protein
MPISDAWFVSGRNDGMRRLKAYFLMMETYKNKKTNEKWCCYFAKNQNEFFNLVHSLDNQYIDTTENEIKSAYEKTLKNLNLVFSKN